MEGNESPLTLDQARELLPGKPAASSLWRWYSAGIRGVRLRTFLCGGRRFTTSAAIAQFIEESTRARDGKRGDDTAKPGQAEAEYSARVARADRELETLLSSRKRRAKR